MYLTFSDSAKFAQAALNLLSGYGLVIGHSFFDPKTLSAYQPGTLFQAKFYPFTPWLLTLFFRFLPATDQTVALVGWLAFAVAVLLVFLIAKKLDRPASGLVAACLFLLSPPFWEYASNGASEIFFAVQILLLSYLTLTHLPWLALLPMLLMFVTRQQAPIILVSCLLTGIYLVFTSKLSRWFKLLVIMIVAMSMLFMARFSLSSTQNRFSPGSLIGTVNLPTNAPQGLFLRGLKYTSVTPTQLAVKTFYNFYNFAKNLSAIASPIVFVLFLWSFFLKKVNRPYIVFTALSFFLLLISASVSLPNSRYIHPVIPLIIISASISLITLVRLAKIKRPAVVVSATLLLVTLPFLGHLTLDARFRRQQQFNSDKPPVYREISRVMAENIPRGKLIITNLDAWAAWYEGLTTMWFPVSPDQLDGFQDKVEFIVITNYLEDDADFALGKWRDVVYTPNQINNPFLKKYYRVLKTFTIDRIDVYENRDFQGTILARRT